YNTGTLKVINCALSNNYAYGSAYGSGYGSGLGGAIYNAGTLSVSGGSISSNSGYFGGGIFNANKQSATITNCTLSGNTATDGAAIWNDGTMMLSGCTVSSTTNDSTVPGSTVPGNTANHAGGGIYNAKDGHLTIQSGSTITSNTAPLGADLYN